MSPPHLGIEVEGPKTAPLMASSTTVESVSKSTLEPKERIYLGLSEDSSEGSLNINAVSKEENGSLHLTSTDLRLGLPGSQSPERDAAVEEKSLFPLAPLKDDVCYPSPKTVVSGNKRGFSEAIDGFPGTKTSTLCERNWMFTASESDSITGTAPNRSCAPQARDMPSKASAEGQHGSNHSKINSSNNSSAPAAKAQVVGWPPVRSFRKNSLVTTSKNNTEVDGKQSSSALFVKVSMEGAPYLRKVDLKTYTTYAELSTSLGKMFSCFSLGKEASEKEMGSERNFKDLLPGSEFVLAYEDKDGDWMLVGDVPWEMFIESCKRLKIMKGSDAIGQQMKLFEACSDKGVLAVHSRLDGLKMVEQVQERVAV